MNVDDDVFGLTDEDLTNEEGLCMYHNGKCLSFRHTCGRVVCDGNGEGDFPDCICMLVPQDEISEEEEEDEYNDELLNVSGGYEDEPEYGR